MLNGVHEVTKSRRKCSVNFDFTDRSYPNQLPEFTEQGQRLGMSLQFSQDVIEISEGK